jgi:outer membrane immunogenic protein
VPSQAQDASAWTGFYRGTQLTYGGGSQQYGSSDPYDIYGTSFGIFAGYMLSSGAWSYGGELAYAGANFHEYDGGSEYEDYHFNHTLDLKGRIGYAVDRALVYGVLGYGFSEWEEGSSASGDLYDVDGALVGFGVDYLATDRVFVGAEVLKRVMDSDYPFDADLTTFTQRAGMTF